MKLFHKLLLNGGSFYGYVGKILDCRATSSHLQYTVA